jgi:hypothetical protein
VILPRMPSNGSSPRPSMRCPFCGLDAEEHLLAQKIANEIRAEFDLPPLAPPDIQTGYQKR